MDPIQTIGTTTQELLSHLKITAKVAVSEVPEEDAKSTYLVEITGDNLGALIGYHGETLNYFQQILSLIVNGKTEEWQRVVVDINEWRLQRKESIKNLVEQAITKLKNTNQSQVLPPMSPFERRVVHTIVAEHPEIESHSEGEGVGRQVILELKK
jgi:spoIIIJ-associated protein